MRRQRDSLVGLGLAFRDHRQPSAEVFGAGALSCVTGSTERMFFFVKAAGRAEPIGSRKKEVVSIGRWRTVGILFGTSLNARFVELAFDAARTAQPDAIVYGPWRVSGPFRVVRFVTRLADLEEDAQQAWEHFTPA